MIGVIGPDQLRTAVTWLDAVDAVGQALLSLGSGRVIQPPAEQTVDWRGNVLHYQNHGRPPVYINLDTSTVIP